MDFLYSEEQLMIREAARDFAQKECLPEVIKRDDGQIFPAAQIKISGTGFYGNDGRS